MFIQANALHIPLADEVVQCVVTSPPYWGLRKYDGAQDYVWGDGWRGAYGLEPLADCGQQSFVQLRRDLTAGQRESIILELLRRGVIR